MLRRRNDSNCSRRGRRQRAITVATGFRPSPLPRRATGPDWLAGSHGRAGSSSPPWKPSYSPPRGASPGSLRRIGGGFEMPTKIRKGGSSGAKGGSKGGKGPRGAPRREGGSATALVQAPAVWAGGLRGDMRERQVSSRLSSAEGQLTPLSLSLSLSLSAGSWGVSVPLGR